MNEKSEAYAIVQVGLGSDQTLRQSGNVLVLGSALQLCAIARDLTLKSLEELIRAVKGRSNELFVDR